MISRKRKLALLERASLKRLPETMLAKVQLIKRVFGLGARVISHVGPSPDACKFCASKPEELREAHIMKVPVIQTTWDKFGNPSYQRIKVLEVDRVKKWRWKGKPVLRRWPDGRQDWACLFCGRGCEE